MSCEVKLGGFREEESEMVSSVIIEGRRYGVGVLRRA